MSQPPDTPNDQWAIARIVEEKAAAAEADRRARIKAAAKMARRELFVQLGWDADRIEAILQESPGGMEYPRAHEIQKAIDGMDEFFDDVARLLIGSGLVPADVVDGEPPPDGSK